MKRQTKRAVVIAAAAMLALSAAACSSPQPGSGDPTGGTVELDFFHRWPNEPKNSYFTEVVKEFEAANPGIKIKTESVLNDSYKDKIKVVAGSANAPDVMFTWSGSFLAELVKGGNVMDLGPWLAEDKEFAESFYPSQVEPLTVDGVQYAVPLGMHSKVFFYDADQFKADGLSAPETWPEFLSVLDKLKASTGKAPIQYGAQDQWTIAHYVGTLNQRVLDPAVLAADQDPAKGQFTDPGYVEALKRFQELSAYMNDDMTAVTHEIARNAWISGEAPIMYMQSAEIGLFGEATFDFGAFNFPAVEGGKGDPNQLTGAPEGFIIAKNTEHPEEAKKFLAFVLSKANGTKYTEQTGELSAVQGAVEAADVKPIAKQLAADIVAASAMTTWLDNAYDPRIVQAYLAETQLMLGGQQTPEDVMKAVQEAAALVRG